MRIIFAAFLMLLAVQAFSQESQGTTHRGVPVTIFETPEQAVHAADREKLSDTHDAADLDAQTRAANAAERSAATAERQELPAFVQIIFGGASTFVAIIALVVSFWTAITSIKTTQTQLRAYVSVFDFETTVTNQNVRPHIAFKVTFKNFGQTPARNLRFNLRWECGQPPFVEDSHATVVAIPEGRGSVGAGMTFYAGDKTDLRLGQSEIQQVLDNKLSFWVFGVIEYDDVFGKQHRTRFRYSMNTGPMNTATFSPCAAGNEET
ncbi:MAG: hypothetical protein EOS64_10050 [Mesorhizobium sp.]|nr:MAG: hypothetical protein EOS64_10050 [Mesorhizobium sp.]